MSFGRSALVTRYFFLICRYVGRPALVTRYFFLFCRYVGRPVGRYRRAVRVRWITLVVKSVGRSVGRSVGGSAGRRVDRSFDRSVGSVKSGNNRAGRWMFLSLLVFVPWGHSFFGLFCDNGLGL